MGKIVIANFSNGETSVRVTGLTQYDYGAVLRIQGLNLPQAVEIHFCLQETGGEAPRRVGTTKDGVTDVIIPDSMLENRDTTQDYSIYAWVYLTDETSGSTERRITMKVRSRSKPEAFDRPEDADLFREAIAAVNEASERAETAEKSAESWAHGHEDYPERDEDNAAYYAMQAKMHVEHASEDAKKEIDEYVKRKEQELKGEPGTQGADGPAGKDGITPHIGENGNWYIGDVDTGVYSRGADGLPGTDGESGTDGVDGVTPHIGENKNWWVGETDTGITAEGKDGAPGQDGQPGQDGEPGQPGKSAYQYAQDGGYTGTEEEFAEKLAAEIPSKTSDIINDSGYMSHPETANVGQIIAVKAVDESGKPIEYKAVNPSSGDTTLIDDNSVSQNKTWSSQKISDELNDCVKFVKVTVNLIGSEGNIPLGNTVYVYEIVNNIETLSYSSICPTGTIVVRISHGIQYRITASADIEGFYAPTEVTGVAINDSEVTIRYTELAYPKTIRDLQTLAKMGLAADVVSIGDEFMTTYTYNGTDMDMPWIVTDIKDVEFEDGSTGQGVYLESKYCTIESVQFDAPHQEVATEETAIEGLYYIGRTDNTYTLLSLNTGDTIPYSDYTYVYHDTIRDTSMNIHRYGNNRVSTSALRQWLNSDADKGQWWKASKIGYRPPSQLNSQKGFMAGLSQEFIDCVAKVKRTYYTNSVTDASVIDVLYDKFFSATGTELYGSVNDNEGTYWTYYKEVTGLSSPSNGNNTGRIKYALNAKTSSQGCWAFSSNRGNSYNVWIRYTAGQLYNNGAHNSYRAVPACVIG